MAVDLDVVVGGDAAALPDGEGAGLVGQRLQRRLVDGPEQFGPARVVALYHARVDVADEFADRNIEIDGAEETPIGARRSLHHHRAAHTHPEKGLRPP